MGIFNSFVLKFRVEGLGKIIFFEFDNLENEDETNTNDESNSEPTQVGFGFAELSGQDE